MAEFTALQKEIAELRARFDDLERVLQLRDAVAAAAPPAPVAPTAAEVEERRIPVPSSYEVTADQLLPAQDGFYQLEWGSEGAFRWTGPDEAVHFEAWINRSAPLKATLRLFHFGVPANAKELSIEVDGTRYPLTRIGKDKLFSTDPIAPRASQGSTRFTLHVPHTHSPAAARGAADKRTLGVAFQVLRVEPA